MQHYLLHLFTAKLFHTLYCVLIPNSSISMFSPRQAQQQDFAFRKSPLTQTGQANKYKFSPFTCIVCLNVSQYVLNKCTALCMRPQDIYFVCMCLCLWRLYNIENMWERCEKSVQATECTLNDYQYTCTVYCKFLFTQCERAVVSALVILRLHCVCQNQKYETISVQERLAICAQ